MISNDPFSIRRVSNKYVWWKNVFDFRELNEIERYCNELELRKGVIFSEREKENFDVSTEYRNSEVNFFHRNEETFWIFDRFNETIDKINKEYFQFDLYGYESIQYTTYDGSEKGHYDWHMDSFIDGEIPRDMGGSDTRKLTVVMLLNDRNNFTGGEFQLNMGKEINAETINFERGMLIVFPSFLIHRVTPVLSGIRKSMVIWVEGPKFR